MFKMVNGVGAVGAAVLACGSALASGPVAACGFDSPGYVLGAIDGQDGWIASPSATPGAADVVKIPRKAGTQALRLDQNATWDPIAATWNCAVSLSGSPIVTVEWDMYFIAGDGFGWKVSIAAPNGAPLGMLWIDGGNLWYKVWSFDPQPGNGFLNSGTWGHFQMTCDWTARNTVFYLNSQEIGRQGWHANPAPGIGGFQISSVMGGYTDAAGVDSVIISTDAPCPADFDGSGFVDTDDYDFFVITFEAGMDMADFDGSGFVDTDDFDAFVRAFEVGC